MEIIINFLSNPALQGCASVISIIGGIWSAIKIVLEMRTSRIGTIKPSFWLILLLVCISYIIFWISPIVVSQFTRQINPFVHFSVLVATTLSVLWGICWREIWRKARERLDKK